jgi:colanic acid biosynthesis glycosyl transferase WcaI
MATEPKRRASHGRGVRFRNGDRNDSDRSRQKRLDVPRILITTQVYPPETHPTALMVRELAEYLAAREWDVTVCAGLPHHPRGRLPEGWRRRPWRRSMESGVELIRVGHLVHPSRTIPVRAAVYVSQAASTALAAFASRKADVVLVYGPPLVGPCLGAPVAARHRAKLATVIYDIYPDVAVETGKVRNPLVIGAARIAERFHYRASDRIVVLSEGFERQLVAKGVSGEKIAVVPVWLDPDEIRPMSRDNAWRTEQEIPLDRFVVLYAGTIGVVSGATIVADAASLLRDRPDILFLFVGEGEEKPKVEASARELGLSNMRFLPFQPRDRLREVQAAADAGLVTLAPGRGRTSVPSKVLGYMAAGRPVIAAADADSDTAAEIEAADCGIVSPPGSASVLAEVVRRAADAPAWRESAGARARARFEATYARDMVLERYRRMLEELSWR